MFPGHALEGCFETVLREVTWPARALALHAESAPRLSSSPPESRALVGQELVLPNPVSLVPVVIAVAAVVVVVGIVVYVTSETAEAPPLVTALPVASAVPTSTAMPMATVVPKIPTADVEARCSELTVECLENKKQPRWNWKKFGREKDCGECGRYCRNENGMWPDDKCPRSGKKPR